MFVPNEGKFGVRKSVKGASDKATRTVPFPAAWGCKVSGAVICDSPCWQAAVSQAGSPVCGQFRPGCAPKRAGMHTRLKFTARGGGFAFRPAAPPLPLTAQTMTQMLQSTRTNWAPVTDQQPPFPQHRLYPSNHPRLLNAAFYHMNNLII
jgi:hypothetical protein